MLANPHLAPFELIDRPCLPQDWTLIDHLMVIHKVKESDYIEDDPQGSILSMARTLALCYISENEGSQCVVLVKDGTRAQKPAVRELRLNRTPAPHMEFCMRNLCAIEYTMMKLLADMGMKNKLFLVTGAKGECEGAKGECEGTSVENLVSFHEKYTEDDSVLPNMLNDLTPPECELCNVYPSYGEIERPDGLEGVFVASFADPASSQVSLLRDACLLCRSTEADTLLVELANVLTGSVTVCSGDSDVVAVLTACGREGITMRMDNKSYREGRDMHTSSFGELLCASPQERHALKPTFGELSSSEDRFRVLCDIAAGDEHLLPETREQHKNFEASLDEHEEAEGRVDLKLNVARYLYLAGIRGSVYVTFLSRFSSKGDRVKVLCRAVDAHCVNAKTVSFLFETLWPASDQGLTAISDSEKPTCVGEKRKISCLQEHEKVPELELDDGVDVAELCKEQENVLRGLKRLSKAYMTGLVQRGSHGRFLRLNRAGRCFFLCIKGDVIRDAKERAEKLVFMALCGTDYNKVPRELGIKRLMTVAVTKHTEFSSWCHSLRSLWDAIDTCSPRDCYNLGVQLSESAKVPKSVQSKYWTEFNCDLMVRSMKYVYELWNLMKPRPGSEYGFSERDGVVCFNCEDSTLDSTLDSGPVQEV